MLVFPDRVLHGAVPNKDFLYLYGPGSLWSLAAVYKVFGTHLLVERLAGLAQLVGHGGGGRAPRALVGPLGRGRGGAAQRHVRHAVAAAHRDPVDGRGRARARFVGRAAASARRRANLAQRAPLGAGRRPARGLRDAVPHRSRRSRSCSAGRPRCGRCPRPSCKRALIGPGIGLAPYVVQLVTAGPVTTFRGMIVDPIIHLRAPRAICRCPPTRDHLVGRRARHRRGRSVVAASALHSGPAAVRLVRPARRPRVGACRLRDLACAARTGRHPAARAARGRALRARHVPAGRPAGRLRAPRVGERHRDRARAGRARRAASPVVRPAWKPGVGRLRRRCSR